MSSLGGPTLKKLLTLISWVHIPAVMKNIVMPFYFINGDFLVRVSTKGNRNEYILSGQFNNKIKHLIYNIY